MRPERPRGRGRLGDAENAHDLGELHVGEPGPDCREVLGLRGRVRVGRSPRVQLAPGHGDRAASTLAGVPGLTRLTLPARWSADVPRAGQRPTAVDA